MGANSNLHTARAVKNDEFYTRLFDVDNEVEHYKEHFIDKVVYCNCDDPSWSSFYKYFTLNFKHLGLKKVITTHYSKDPQTDPPIWRNVRLGRMVSRMSSKQCFKEMVIFVVLNALLF